MLSSSDWKRSLALFLFVVAALLVLGAVTGKAQAGACDGAFVVLNAPEGVNVDTLEAVDGYLASVYGADDRPHVLAFYSDYSDIQAVLGRLVPASFADYSGFALRRVRWSTERCKHEDDGIRARVALASTRFTGSTMFGLIVHEISHMHGTPDSTEAHGASWWEDLAAHSYNGTCGQAAWEAQGHCIALRALIRE